jgi:hypothetical protein
MRALLLMLTLVASACATAPRDDRVEIPFRYVNSVILIETYVGGQGPYTFLLDTGVTPSGVDTALAAPLGIALDEDRSGAAEGVGSDNVTAYEAQLQDVMISGVNYGDLEAAAIPMAGLSRRLGEPLHGILGESFLAGRIVTIDYQRETVTLGAPAPRPGPDVYQFPMVTAPDDILPLMQVNVGGRSLTASMDTGSNGGLEVFASAVAGTELESAVAGWEASVSEGARGPRETRRGTWPVVTVGPFALENVRGAVASRDPDASRQANAGNALFENFVVTFDYVNRAVTLRRVR